ncbi:YheC/YheD family protein [Bacillus timonensis]|nr:YheC/YheD family protein [Bacillus timonensis]
MITLGFLTLRPHQEKRYFTEIAKLANNLSIAVYRFTPTSINPLTEQASGERFDHTLGTWKKEEFLIPTFIYDRCFYSDDDISKRSRPIVNWLKARPSTCFLGKGLPNKWEIYEALLKDKEITPYLPDTSLVSSKEEVLSLLINMKKILLKPINGSRGNGIVACYLRAKSIETLVHGSKGVNKQQFTTKKDFYSWLTSLLSRNYLIQPLLPLVDHEKRPFDIRILLQKKEHGNWFEQGRGIRKGSTDTVTSNISNGGEIIPYNQWIDSLPSHQKTLIAESLSTIIEKLPSTLEKNFPPLFELGIDIGIEADGSVWILDINSKPGHKVILETSKDRAHHIYSTPLLYCLYLNKNLLAKKEMTK